MNNLFRLRSSNASYREWFGSTDIAGFDVYNDQGERFGKVVDILIDETQHFYYLAVDTGSWLNRKQVLLPLEKVRVDHMTQRIYVIGLNRAQAAHLPVYDSAVVIDKLSNHNVESTHERVSPVPSEIMLPLEASVPLENSEPLEAPIVENTVVPLSDKQVYLSGEQTTEQLTAISESQLEPSHTEDIPSDRSPEVRQKETLRLLEERLIVNRYRRKVGEVVVRKEIETHIIQVPVRREKLIVEQVSPEYKRIATIELEPEEMTAVDSSHTSQSVSNPIVDEASISAEAASQILRDMISSAGHQAVKVRLVFEDREHQSMYQQRLERSYSATRIG